MSGSSRVSRLLPRTGRPSFLDGTAAQSPSADPVRRAPPSQLEGAFLSRLDGSGPQQQTSNIHLTRLGLLRFAPDGSRIAYVSDRNGNPDVYSVRPRGGPKLQHTSSSGSERFPTWGPNGDRMAFERNREIYTKDGTQGAVRQVTQNGGAAPFWSPVQ